MNDRIKKLRSESLDARPSLSSERAELMTRFYRDNPGFMPEPLRRARAFRFLLENKQVYIGPGEWIVGEKGPSPKAAPTFPELCCHSLGDLDMLHAREKIPFTVSPESRRMYETEIIPFWKGRSIRDLIFSEMTEDWLSAYQAGVFTEFMEQRAPGHTVLDGKIYAKGMLDFKQDIQKARLGLDFMDDEQALSKSHELEAMAICADALIRYAARHAEQALAMAGQEKNPIRKKELQEIAEICGRVPAHAPRDFHEALQYYWFVHLGVTTELNTWDSYCPGHLDRHLYPFYERGLKNGTLTRESAEELLQCLWIKFNNQPAPPKVGVTAAESGTYTDFCQINLGGVDENGGDGVNDLTYLLLDVVEEMRLLQPSSSIQVSRTNPDRFIRRAVEIIRTGFGQPSVFNSDLIVRELLRMGKSVEDARAGGSSGCVEVGAFGKEAYILTGYFNLPKILELALNNGMDKRTGSQLGPPTGDPRDFTDFNAFYNAFEKQMRHFIDIKIRGNQVIERLFAGHMPAPFLSLLTDDCIAKGMDYHDGGARYNTTYIQGVGLGTVTDGLSAIRHHVYEKKTWDLDQLLRMLRDDFNGFEKERQILLNKTPRYGNDEDDADEVMRRVFESYFRFIDGRKNTRGGEYRINLLPTTVHVYFGSVTGALPDGRKAGLPLSEGISPVQGADRKGPTAVLRSAAKMDHERTGGTLLNQKLSPGILKDSEGMDKLVGLIRAFFRMNGHHIQFNVVDRATLTA
ncbi:glycyl radical protein, partial [bacterium]|nr:glycyl radical protein [bacterium]